MIKIRYKRVFDKALVIQVEEVGEGIQQTGTVIESGKW